MKKALIGSYLAEHLLGRGYQVYGQTEEIHARQILGWKAETEFRALVRMMVRADVDAGDA